MAVHSCCKLIYPLIKVGLLTKAFSFYLLCELQSVLQGFLPPSLLLNICTIFKCTLWLLLYASLCLEQSELGLCPVSSHSLEYKLTSFSVINGLVVLGTSFKFIAAFCLDHVSILLCPVSLVTQFLRKGRRTPLFHKPSVLTWLWCVQTEANS